MSEDMTNVADDETEIAETNATEPAAQATPADVTSPEADAANEAPAEMAEPVADAPVADDASAEDSAVSTTETTEDAPAEAVSENEPTQEEVAAEAVADWSPTQELSSESSEAAPETASAEAAAEQPAADGEAAVATEIPVAEAVEQPAAEGEAAVATEIPVAEAVEQPAAEGEAAQPATEGAAAAATEGEAGQERARRRDGKRDRGARNANKRKLETVTVGEELSGVVRSLQTYGAFVDVGAERDGLVHISELRDGFVEKVEDVVKEGDTVHVRVKEVDVGKGRLSLTMRPPRDERAPRPAREGGEAGEGERPRRERSERAAPAERRERAPREGGEQDNRIKLRDLVEGATLTGKVTSIVDYGAFIDIGAATDGLVHISEIQEDRVNKVSDVLSEGQEVQVRVLTIDKKRNRVSLSMKPASEAVDTSYQYEEEQGGIEVPSPMKDAFDRAREKKRRDKRGNDRGRKNRFDDDVDDIINRTLRWRD